MIPDIIPVLLAPLVENDFCENRWKERVIEIIKDAVKIEQEFLTDALPVRKVLPKSFTQPWLQPPSQRSRGP